MKVSLEVAPISIGGLNWHPAKLNANDTFTFQAAKTTNS
jgi:uncharacterized protein with PIN domain